MDLYKGIQNYKNGSHTAKCVIFPYYLKVNFNLLIKG